MGVYGGGMWNRRCYFGFPLSIVKYFLRGASARMQVGQSGPLLFAGHIHTHDFIQIL